MKVQPYRSGSTWKSNHVDPDLHDWENHLDTDLYACCVTAVDDHGGRRGDTVQIIDQWRRSVAPREVLVLLYWAMHSKSQRRIRMVFKIVGKPSIFFNRQLETKVIQQQFLS